MIRNFIDDDQYDEIIEKAIAYHSLYKIPNNLEPSLLKQVLLIRDSDKLDNFRVKNIESIQTCLVFQILPFIVKEFLKIF